MLIGVTALAAFVAFLGRSDANGTVRSSTPTVQLHTLLITHGQDANVDLSSVSCVNPTFCIAVGTRHAPSDGPLGSPVILRFDGRSWSKMAAPAIADAALNGVSCVSRAACVAVGQQVVSELVSSSPLIEELRGATWSVTASSSPAYFPVNANLLQAVSCLSANRCTAVGWDDGSGYPRNVSSVEGLVGTRSSAGWSVTSFAPLVRVSEGSAMGPIVVPSSAFDLFTPTSVSCETSVCLAVGGGRSVMNEGQTWTSLSTLPALIYGIACGSGMRCIGVGDDSGTTGTYIATLHGSTWKRIASPNSSASSNMLEAVACSRDHLCVAVGSYSGTPTPGQFRGGTLVEFQAKGVWRLAPSLRTPADVDDALMSVSCPGSHVCIAVGNSTVNAFHEPQGPGSALALRIIH
jgi:hypothetical protein